MRLGVLDWFRRGRSDVQEKRVSASIDIVGASNEAENAMTFDDKNITFTGDLVEYDYDRILRDKQANINSLYELSDYYVDKDPIFRGVVKGVYTPFSVADHWQLIGSNEKTKAKYEEYYKRIHLKDRMRSIFFQYYKYGNVFIYLMPDGNLITLPVHKVRIGNVLVNGEPVIEFNARAIKDDLKQKGMKALQNYREDEVLDIRLEGYPPEVAEAIKKNADWVQLDPANTFVLQDIKEDWTRYAIPMIASALSALAKKELIEQYEASLLNLGMRGFLHVTYGDADPKSDLMPDVGMLNKVQALFKRAMTGGAIATTNPWAKAEFVNLDTDKLFETDKYKGVNSEILAAGGVSGIIVSGRADDGSTFASAQVSMQTVAIRIKQAKANFCEMMDRVNMRLNNGKGGVTHSSPESVPKFTFPPTDLSNSTKLQETCYKLWQAGVLSNQTMLDVHGYDIGQEIERIEDERAKGFIRPGMPDKEQETSLAPDDDEKKERGRPAMDVEDRVSDESKSESGRAPKPSNPDGSMQ